jgi:hypothetical protein
VNVFKTAITLMQAVENDLYPSRSIRMTGRFGRRRAQVQSKKRNPAERHKMDRSEILALHLHMRVPFSEFGETDKLTHVSRKESDQGVRDIYASRRFEFAYLFGDRFFLDTVASVLERFCHWIYISTRRLHEASKIRV